LPTPPELGPLTARTAESVVTQFAGTAPILGTPATPTLNVRDELTHVTGRIKTSHLWGEKVIPVIWFGLVQG
jgi:hypothetical protein